MTAEMEMDGYYWIVIYDQLQVGLWQGGSWWAVGWERPLCLSDVSFVVERIPEPGEQFPGSKRLEDMIPKYCC